MNRFYEYGNILQLYNSYYISLHRGFIIDEIFNKLSNGKKDYKPEISQKAGESTFQYYCIRHSDENHERFDSIPEYGLGLIEIVNNKLGIDDVMIQFDKERLFGDGCRIPTHLYGTYISVVSRNIDLTKTILKSISDDLQFISFGGYITEKDGKKIGPSIENFKQKLKNEGFSFLTD